MAALHRATVKLFSVSQLNVQPSRTYSSKRGTLNYSGSGSEAVYVAPMKQYRTGLISVFEPFWTCSQPLVLRPTSRYFGLRIRFVEVSGFGVGTSKPGDFVGSFSNSVKEVSIFLARITCASPTSDLLDSGSGHAGYFPQPYILSSQPPRHKTPKA